MDASHSIRSHDDFQSQLSGTTPANSARLDDTDSIDHLLFNNTQKVSHAPQNMIEGVPPRLRGVSISSKTRTTSSPSWRRDQRHLLSQSESEATCPCIDRILHVNEIVQLQLVSSFNAYDQSDVNIDDILQKQKQTLGCVESLLRCRQCSSRSDYVTLAASLCREMMNSIERLNCLVMSHEYPDAFQSPAQRSRSRDFKRADLRKNDTKNIMATGRWRLDDEAEAQVFWSLIETRIEKLYKLLQQLEEVAKAKRLKCLSILQAIREGLLETHLDTAHDQMKMT